MDALLSLLFFFFFHCLEDDHSCQLTQTDKRNPTLSLNCSRATLPRYSVNTPSSVTELRELSSVKLLRSHRFRSYCSTVHLSWSSPFHHHVPIDARIEIRAAETKRSGFSH
ncbi:hypothetical protein CRG98_023303 [Punica granatum]|uniref:Secreted protein n=1 Tax=Punica granatum TaxID=22663 RepID=A0A2I0JJ45_PUNGR|nr:hypothetical protein CRG98_023303 [Punica granatum]